MFQNDKKGNTCRVKLYFDEELRPGNEKRNTEDNMNLSASSQQPSVQLHPTTQSTATQV